MGKKENTYILIELKQLSRIYLMYQNQSKFISKVGKLDYIHCLRMTLQYNILSVAFRHNYRKTWIFMRVLSTSHCNSSQKENAFGSIVISIDVLGLQQDS